MSSNSLANTWLGLCCLALLLFVVDCRLATLDLQGFPCRNDAQCQGTLRCIKGLCRSQASERTSDGALELPGDSSETAADAEPAIDTEPAADESVSSEPDASVEPPHREASPDDAGAPEITPEPQPEKPKAFQVQWFQAPGGEPKPAVETIAVAAGPKGSVYVGGSFEELHAAKKLSNGNGSDAFVAQYDANGKLLWVEVFGGTVGGDIVNDLRVAADGSLLLTGFFYGKVTFGAQTASSQKQPDTGVYNSDIFVARLVPPSTGNAKLTLLATIGSPYYDFSSAILSEFYDKQDGSARIYLGYGVSRGPKLLDGKTSLTTLAKGEIDFGVSALAGDGTHRWSRFWGGKRWDYAVRRSLAIDADKDGYVYVLGVFSGSLVKEDDTIIATSKGGRDGILFKLRKRDGQTMWHQVIAGDGYDSATAMVREPASGDLLISGEFDNQLRVTLADGTTRTLQSNGKGDIFLLRMTSEGKITWAQQYGGAAHEGPRAIALGPQGQIYLTGVILSGIARFGPYPKAVVGATNTFVLRVNGVDGAVQEVTSFPGPENIGYSLAVNGDGKIFVGGRFDGGTFFGPFQKFPAQGAMDNFLLMLQGLP